MPQDREALKKSLYEANSSDDHTQLLIKGTLSIIEAQDQLPCEKHGNDIGKLKGAYKYTLGFVAAVSIIIGLILTLIKIFS